MNAADEGAEAAGCGARGFARAVDDAAVDDAVEEEAAKHEQRADDEGAVDLVDVELVFDQAIERGGALGEGGCGAGLFVIEEVSDEEADGNGKYGD